MRRLLGVLVIACLGALALPATAGAGELELDLDLVSPAAPLTFSATLDGVACDPGTINLQTLLLNGAPVEPISVSEDPADPNVLLIVLPDDSTPGNLLAVVGCEDGDPVTPQTDEQGFASVVVTKVVEGEVPVDAAFTVNVDCVALEIMDAGVTFDGVSPADIAQDFDVDLPYGATGGVGYVYTDHEVECTVTEPETGGASSVTIDPETITIVEAEAFASTVTNTFPSPIVVEPTFTG